MAETPNKITWYLVSETKLQEIVQKAAWLGKDGADTDLYLTEIFANAEDMATPVEDRNRADAGGSGLVRFDLEVDFE